MSKNRFVIETSFSENELKEIGNNIKILNKLAKEKDSEGFEVLQIKLESSESTLIRYFKYNFKEIKEKHRSLEETIYKVVSNYSDLPMNWNSVFTEIPNEIYMEFGLYPLEDGETTNSRESLTYYAREDVLRHKILKAWYADLKTKLEEEDFSLDSFSDCYYASETERAISIMQRFLAYNEIDGTIFVIWDNYDKKESDLDEQLIGLADWYIMHGGKAYYLGNPLNSEEDFNMFINDMWNCKHENQIEKIGTCMEVVEITKHNGIRKFAN